MMAAGPMAAVAAAAGPTGAAGPLFLSPTKRTVLSILARAKAAQNQHPIAAAVAASAYKHRPPPPPHPHHISAHHGLTGMTAPFHKNNLYGNPTNLLLN